LPLYLRQLAFLDSEEKDMCLVMIVQVPTNAILRLGVVADTGAAADWLKENRVSGAETLELIFPSVLCTSVNGNEESI
jgi:hypothetical protein